ncbi:hypothetical protein [Roseicella aquatilis]|uniref:HIRAN domain-containing protein n=1 Tax=Roseicella aquatilis TaxID=2527868 RepID=A0A4R4D270_9PROT|nr:hypothetical protein [Roseicella aquatilis]TCZ52273.1 hypothetical protein EXY23_26215 [Roseicella aquatilis]
MPHPTAAAAATVTHLVDTGAQAANGAVWQTTAGDRLDLHLVSPQPPRIAAHRADGRCVGHLAPEAARRVAPLLAAGRPLDATVTALVPRPRGGPPRVQVALGLRRRAA